MSTGSARTAALLTLALASFVYAAAIAIDNLNQLRERPAAQRIALDSWESLPQDVEFVRSYRSFAPGLIRGDVSVRIGQRHFPASADVWMDTAVDGRDPAHFLQRFRLGRLEFDASAPEHAVSPVWLYLIEVPQDFAKSGDAPEANFWLMPVHDAGADTAPLHLRADAPIAFAHRLKLDEARADPRWRATLAESYAPPVRAVPALAALIVGLAAAGSLLFALWRAQPWSVFATTLTFIVPMISAAPFLTAFGWLPILPAAVLGFVLTTAIVCALEQRLLPVLQQRRLPRLMHRVVEALTVPVAALLIGTTLVTSLASVSVIEWRGLGGASPGALFMESLVWPAVGLLIGGAGTCLLLILFYLVLSWRRRRVTGIEGA